MFKWIKAWASPGRTWTFRASSESRAARFEQPGSGAYGRWRPVSRRRPMPEHDVHSRAQRTRSGFPSNAVPWRATAEGSTLSGDRHRAWPPRASWTCRTKAIQSARCRRRRPPAPPVGPGVLERRHFSGRQGHRRATRESGLGRRRPQPRLSAVEQLSKPVGGWSHDEGFAPWMIFQP